MGDELGVKVLVVPGAGVLEGVGVSETGVGVKVGVAGNAGGVLVGVSESGVGVKVGVSGNAGGVLVGVSGSGTVAEGVGLCAYVG